MRHGRWLLGVTALILVAVAALGPRVEVDTQVDPVVLPDDLNDYLEQAEGAFSDLRPGTEKRIVWADSITRSRTDLAIVYVHGFSASRQEVAPLCDSLASHFKANLFYTRLTGHGRSGDALGEAKVNDWLYDAVEALAIGRKLGRKVMVIGTSTGATLVAWAASTQPTDGVVAIVLMSPNFGLHDERSSFLLWPWGEFIAETLIGPERSWVPRNEMQQQFWTTSYPTKALLPMMALVDLSKRSVSRGITVPTLTLYSEEDRSVNPDDTKQLARFMTSPASAIEAVDTEDRTGHVLAGRILSPGTTATITDRIETFLRQALSPETADQSL